jgi:hypothetical protein
LAALSEITFWHLAPVPALAGGAGEEVVALVCARALAPMLRGLWDDPASALWTHADVPRTFQPSRQGMR